MIYSAIGPDLDIDEAKMLHPEQKILVEFDGQDANPGLLSSSVVSGEIPWAVDSVTAKRCTLKHTLVKSPLTIYWGNSLFYRPAVFSCEAPDGTIKKSSMSLGKYPVVLKYSAYNISHDEAKKRTEKVKRAKRRARNCKQNNDWLAVRAASEVKKLNQKGWVYNSINRCALRTSASFKVVAAIMGSEIGEILEMGLTRDELIRIYEASKLVKIWAKQNREYGMSKEVTDIPTWQNRA